MVRVLDLTVRLWGPVRRRHRPTVRGWIVRVLVERMGGVVLRSSASASAYALSSSSLSHQDGPRLAGSVCPRIYEAQKISNKSKHTFAYLFLYVLLAMWPRFFVIWGLVVSKREMNK
jgi:hypothetical protein